MTPVGYGYLIERFALPALPLPVKRGISEAVPARRSREIGGQSIEEFATSYAPEPTVLGHLGFALRYEGLDLAVLSLLFAKIGPDALQVALHERPVSVTTRRLAFLFEWLTGEVLDLPVGALEKKLRYEPVLDEKLQYGLTGKANARFEKFKIIDNLPGTSAFCPLVRKTDYLEAMIQRNLKARTHETLGKYDPQLVRRAAAFLYLKETHSSFDIERVKPSASRAQRFADLLKEAETGAALSEERFVELQNAVVDPRWMEASFRFDQNWLGTRHPYRTKVDFVPARPEHVRSLMEGLMAMAHRQRERPEAIDPVLAAAAVSFGFVFVHPFKDGNGRLHRYLIHEQLSSAGFTPKGIILPVSAVMLANLDRYKDALEAFSRPVNALTSYDPAVPTARATGNEAAYFRYFDATEQASFLYDAIERTVEHDLDEEISYLLGFDRARRALSDIADWPAHSVDLFIRVVHQNGDRLSATKRSSHFEWLRDEEVTRFEGIVTRSFDPTVETGDIFT